MIGHAISLKHHLEVQLALAVVLQSMSYSAVDGLTVKRTQAVTQYLLALANSPLVLGELRNTCGNLAKLWQSIDAV